MQTYPLWEANESIAQYAQRANLPLTLELDFKGIKFESVLVPAGKFTMGVPEPVPPDAVLTSKIIFAVGVALLIVLLSKGAWKAFRHHQRPRFSLSGLMIFVIVTSITLYGGVRWHHLDSAWQKYFQAMERFKIIKDNEKPAHTVTLTQPFYMGMYEITQEQYEKFCSTNLDRFIGPKLPIVKVNWQDAKTFCEKASLSTRRTIKLPTEAQWEYASRGGAHDKSYFNLNEVAWYSDNSGLSLHPVGKKSANFLGLFDMQGNVFEWCEDWYDEDYYTQSTVIDPSGPDHGQYRILRGGAWNYGSIFCRTSYRKFSAPNNRTNEFGFRVVVLLP